MKCFKQELDFNGRTRSNDRCCEVASHCNQLLPDAQVFDVEVAFKTQSTSSSTSSTSISHDSTTFGQVSVMGPQKRKSSSKSIFKWASIKSSKSFFESFVEIGPWLLNDRHWLPIQKSKQTIFDYKILSSLVLLAAVVDLVEQCMASVWHLLLVSYEGWFCISNLS